MAKVDFWQVLPILVFGLITVVVVLNLVSAVLARANPGPTALSSIALILNFTAWWILLIEWYMHRRGSMSNNTSMILIIVMISVLTIGVLFGFVALYDSALMQTARATIIATGIIAILTWIFALVYVAYKILNILRKRKEMMI